LDSLSAHFETLELRYLDIYLAKIKFPRRPVLDYLFYRNKKRMNIEKNVECFKHHGTCSVKFTSIEQGFEDIYRCVRDFKSIEDLMASVYAEIVSKYYVNGTDFVIRMQAHWGSYTEYYRELYTSDSQIAIRPLTPHKNTPIPTNVVMPSFLREIVGILSGRYLRQLTGIDMNVRPGSLAELCLKRLSWERILYEQWYGMQQVIYTTNNVSPSKMIALYKTFDNDGAMRGFSFATLRGIIPRGLRHLERMLDCENRVGTMLFRYSPEKLFKYIKIGTSGGIISTRTGQETIKGNVYCVKNSGDKIHHLEAAIKHFHRFIYCVCTGKKHVFQPLCVLKIKGEFKFGHEKDVEGLMQMLMKSREFFIPSVDMVFLSTLLFEQRMFFERGNLIRIGMKYWHGGAYELAKFLNYDNPDIFFFDGDIEGLDKKIKDWQLYLYIASGSRYFDWKSMNSRQVKVLKKLIRILMYHISNKVVLCTGTFWRIMRGVMYSGGKETSHGDSWIMGFVFCCYIVYTMDKYPGMMAAIEYALDRRFLAIVVYGDDHIICCPKILRNIINVQYFSEFLSTYMDMILRDYREYDTFLSIPDDCGGLKYKGPRFLKVFFIANTINPELPAVLPYTLINERMLRLFSDAEGYAEKYILKAISAAWMSFGTNDFFFLSVSF